MDAKLSAKIRSSAYFLSVIAKAFATLTFIGTTPVVLGVLRAGWSIGAPFSHNLVLWIVGFSGLGASITLAGVGSSLAMLCALYDRQDRNVKVVTKRDKSALEPN